MDHPTPLPAGSTLVVAGNGMVGERFLAELARADLLEANRVVVVGEEPRAAYDRVHLSAYVGHGDAAALSLADPGLHTHPSVEVRLGRRVAAVDRDARTVTLDDGEAIAYDALVLATGSTPFVPPIPGAGLPGCHVYRTIEDLDAIRADAERPDAQTGARTGPRTGVVIGGGLLGLEAADALRLLGLSPTVVEFAPRLMPRQLDQPAADALRRHVESLGIAVRVGTATRAITTAADGLRLDLGEGGHLDADVVVFSAGIRPRDELARACGLPVGERGGVVVDPHMRTADPRILAIGECASVDGVVHGLVAPGYAMARVAAAGLAGRETAFEAPDGSTQLKLLGVDVASFGDALGETPGSRALVWDDPVAAVHRKVVVSADGTRVLGGILVGDADGLADLRQLAASGRTPVGPLAALAAPRLEGAPSPTGGFADDDLVCTCSTVTHGQLCTAIRDGELTALAEVKRTTTAATGCGSCTALCQRVLDGELEARGVTVDRSLCPHFAHTRQDLYDVVRVRGLRTFDEVLAAAGRSGSGCEICKPAVASILATLHNEHVLDAAHAPLQDTNDRFLANIQKDGTYSVVPRVPGGEITPDGLLAIGQVAKDFDLYTKITGGQRIDLFGARLEQLPLIWARLVDAGFESGHAYGKSLRTVKSCVGQTWCRYGVQDSTALAIALEERYRGLRSPHKIKMGVSGCSRECAEAQGKDVGVIATEAGWNLYVAGNGGMTPRHATLLATDLSTEDLVRTIDRFLAYYVRTADRLERTAPWLERIEGGIDHVRAVVCDDALDLGADLDAHIAHHVATYACEWAATLADPVKLAAFTSYVNADGDDGDVQHVRERGQPRPARPEERRLLPVLVGGSS